MPQPDMDGHVVTVLPCPGIDLHPLISQPDGFGFLSVLSNGPMDEREQVPKSGFREDSRNEPDPRLCSVEDLICRSSALVLERIGVYAHSLSSHSSSDFPCVVHVLDGGKDILCNVWDGLPVEATRLLGTDNATRTADQKIVQSIRASKLLCHFHSRIKGKVNIVQDPPQQRRLDPLYIHDQIGNRAAEESMCHDNWCHCGEWDDIDFLDIVLAVFHQNDAALMAPCSNLV